MQQFAWEEDNLILLRHDRLVTSFADVNAVFQMRVVNPQFTPFKLPGFAMEEVDKGQVSRRYAIAAVIAVEVEEVPVVAGRDLGLHIGSGKFLHAEFVQNLRQHGFNACQYHVLVMRQFHQNAGAAVFVVHNAAIRAGRDYFAGAEVGFMFHA